VSEEDFRNVVEEGIEKLEQYFQRLDLVHDDFIVTELSRSTQKLTMARLMQSYQLSLMKRNHDNAKYNDELSIAFKALKPGRFCLRQVSDNITARMKEKPGEMSRNRQTMEYFLDNALCSHKHRSPADVDEEASQFGKTMRGIKEKDVHQYFKSQQTLTSQSDVIEKSETVEMTFCEDRYDMTSEMVALVRSREKKKNPNTSDPETSILRAVTPDEQKGGGSMCLYSISLMIWSRHRSPRYETNSWSFFG
jgi:hypothetical protein